MRINNLSETAVTLTFGVGISQEVLEHIMHFRSFVLQKNYSWLQDTVPAYASLSIFVFPEFYKEHCSLKTFFGGLYEEFTLADQVAGLPFPDHFELKVRYCGEDLDLVAAFHGISINDVIAIHTLPLYTVAMLGFTPGFPYLSGMSERLSMPRKAVPALKIPAGSVAIGGLQTGIYPRESPGGWHIIGFTDAELFNTDRTPPNLLKVGDRVKFIATEIR